MVTAPMMNSNVDVNLPQANAKSLQDKKHPVIVSVNADGSLGLTMDGADKQTVDEAGMKARVAAIVKQNPDVNVLVAGDKNGKYDGVYKVLADRSPHFYPESRPGQRRCRAFRAQPSCCRIDRSPCRRRLARTPATAHEPRSCLHAEASGQTGKFRYPARPGQHLRRFQPSRWRALAARSAR